MQRAVFLGEVRHSRVDQGKERKMESPPRLGVGTIYIAPLHGKTDLTTRIWVWSLGMAWEGVRHLRPPDPWVNFHSLCLKS